MSNIGKGELLEVMPKDIHHRIDDEVMADIDKMFNDDGMADSYKENLLSYTSVMQDGKFKVSSYLQAVKYATHKLIGDTNHVAFSRVFPDKIANWKAEGKPQKEIARYTTAYNQSKLVSLIMKQAKMPTHVLNQDVFQDAINVQARIMADEGVSPKVRSDAANSLLTHLKAPEASKIELDVSVKQNDVMAELREVSNNFAKAQQQQVLNGEFSVKEIAEAKIIKEEE